jgi:hypothetical protein
MEKNKTGKYFKYAIGEIILVVIGILIALQINNWNNERIRNNAEDLIIEQLQTDLETSEAELERVKSFYLLKAQASAQVTRAFFKTEIPNESILDSIHIALSSSIYSPILGSARSLINSGNIDLISSTVLKNEIVSYVEKVDYILKDISRYEETYYRKGVEKAYDIMPLTFLSVDSLNKFTAKRLQSKHIKERFDLQLNMIPTDVKKVPFRSDINKLFQNKEFFVAYRKLWVAHRNMYYKYDMILEHTKYMLKRLKKIN